MNYRKLFGYGALIWVIAYFAAMILVVAKLNNEVWSGFPIAFVAVLVAAWAGTKINRTSVASVLKYSLSWVVIGLVLDLIFTVPFTGWQIFSALSYWLSYFLIAVLPIFTSKKIF